MRIIGGAYKRRKLHAVPGTTLRPSSDRLREAVFNILSDTLQDAVVLDLFAGTGAFGLEAVSRGAAFAAFVDDSPAACALIRKNIDRLGVAGNTAVVTADAVIPLPVGIKRRGPYTHLFLDPPYNRDHAPAALSANRDCFTEGARIVVEHPATAPVPDFPPFFETVDRRRYGKALVTFLRYMI